jgi:hypothetical protein
MTHFVVRVNEEGDWRLLEITINVSARRHGEF